MKRPTLQAHQILTDATTIDTLIAPALANLDLGLAGWPASTPGASPAEGSGSSECPRRDCTNERPCHTHGDDVALTATERLGLAPDKARGDLERLVEIQRIVAPLEAEAAAICSWWGLNGIDDTTVKNKLKGSVKERLDAIWCRNCARAGVPTCSRIGRQECSFCESFRLTGACGLSNPNNYAAPKALLDIHFSRNLNSADVVRCMTDTYGFGWNRKATKKGHRVA